jgi:hypothetical protein
VYGFDTVLKPRLTSNQKCQAAEKITERSKKQQARFKEPGLFLCFVGVLF